MEQASKKTNPFYKIFTIIGILSILSACSEKPTNTNTLDKFIATGNEPGWNINIKNNSVNIVTYYGDNKELFYLDDSDVAVSNDIIIINHKDTSITIANEICQDTMIEREYDYKVILKTNNEVFNGCGYIPE